MSLEQKVREVVLLVEQMDMLRDDFVAYSEGKKTVPFVVLRDALVAALNAYDEARDDLPAIAERLARVEGLEADAERYRRLKQSALVVSFNSHIEYSPGYSGGDAEMMEAFIDAHLEPAALPPIAGEVSR